MDRRVLVAAGRLVKIVRTAGNSGSGTVTGTGGTGGAVDGTISMESPSLSTDTTDNTPFRSRKKFSIVSNIRASQWLDQIEVIGCIPRYTLLVLLSSTLIS